MTTSDQHLDEPIERPVDVSVARSRPVVSSGVGGPVAGRSVGEIRALCDGATPTPWAQQRSSPTLVYGDERFPMFVCDTGHGHQAEADAAFIAAARELVPALLAEVEAAHRFEQSAEAEVAQLVESLERVTEARDAFKDERNEARAKVRAVELVRCWTNEDGRRFMFVDDVAAALGIPS
jgi:hypothetical protein